jgi:hypothetical protein
MIIYKITNLINNKVYIGKTIKSTEWRFKKHCYDARKNPNTKNHFHRALLHYGQENFKIEQIDSASTKTELNEKEQYWIHYYKAKEAGYNMTYGGDGGNTYATLSKEELDQIKVKIGEKNSGKLNGQSKQIKCKSIITNEELIFDTITECLEYFKVKNKNFIHTRIDGDCASPWHNEWLFAYADKDYRDYCLFDPSTRKGTKIKLVKDKEEYLFNSISKAAEFLKSSKSRFTKDAKVLGYQIIYL